MPRQKHIYIAYTGGTIGMQRSRDGYIPTPGFIAEQMAQMPELQQAEMPRYTIHEFATPIDSSNMTPDHWNMIAQNIAENYGKYDGFIILHGTDTMAYTASALSFMLENMNKPVILTGSQLPLSEVRNDARATLITALLLASHCNIPEVCLYFDNQLLRGNRARKISTNDFAAFASPNCLPLATLGIDVAENKTLWLKAAKKPLQIQPIKSTNLACLKLFPGLSASMLENLLQPPLQALVLETYGSGNAPDKQPEFLRILKAAIDRGVMIINCTQCWHGGVNMQQYATGKALFDAGVISAADITPEAALTKLFYLFSKKLSVAKIKQQMQNSLRGEISL